VAAKMIGVQNTFHWANRWMGLIEDIWIRMAKKMGVGFAMTLWKHNNNYITEHLVCDEI